MNMKCPRCNGSGEVKVTNNGGWWHMETCPHCGGEGWVH